MRHYDQGKNILPEDRPVTVQTVGNILSYKISYSQHKEFYDFESPEEILKGFWGNMRKRFVPSTEEVLMKCVFFIKNFQPAPAESRVPITNLRYWSTSVYKTRYFNYYVNFIFDKRYKKKELYLMHKVVAPGDSVVLIASI